MHSATIASWATTFILLIPHVKCDNNQKCFLIVDEQGTHRSCYTRWIIKRKRCQDWLSNLLPYSTQKVNFICRNAPNEGYTAGQWIPLQADTSIWERGNSFKERGRQKNRYHDSTETPILCLWVFPWTLVFYINSIPGSNTSQQWIGMADVSWS